MKLAFYKGRVLDNPQAHLIDNIICWWTRSKYSHVEVVIAETDYGSICWSSSFRDGGVRKKLIDIESGHWDIVETDWDVEKAVKWFKENVGAKYDILALLGFIIPFNFNTENKFFCSEAIARSLDFDNAEKTDPKHLYLLSMLSPAAEKL